MKRVIIRSSNGLSNAEPVEAPPSSKASITGTEDWAGEKLAEFLKGRAAWSESAGRWIRWDGKRWNSDAGAQMIAEAMKCARALSAEGVQRDDKAIISTIRSRHSAKGAEAALKVARSHLIDGTRWNPDPHLLNCLNGVVNLKTGELLPHDPKYLMTMMCPVIYDPEARCPAFMAALTKFQPDPKKREYLQRQYGYRATGEVGCRLFFCQIGEGSNGKSTIENIFARVLGDYHAEAAGGLFLQSIHADFAKDPSSHSEPLFAIRYKRNVLLKEPENRHRLDESLIKQFTDGENSVYRSRTLHKEGVDTPVTQKIVFYSNSPPRMSRGYAISRRLHALHWEVRISRSEENPNFASMFLLPEMPGILNWIVQGAVQFYADGAKLDRPSFIDDGQEVYHGKSDALIDFLDRHILRDGAGLPFQTFNSNYGAFCERAKVKPTGVNHIGKALAAQGLEIQVFNKGARHPQTGVRLDKELRWIPGISLVD